MQYMVAASGDNTLMLSEYNLLFALLQTSEITMTI